LIRLVLTFTVGCEALGALGLWLAFRGELERPAWQAVFHAVAAFANAGFSLLPDNLSRFRGDLAVNAAVMILIVLGGLASWRSRTCCVRACAGGGSPSTPGSWSPPRPCSSWAGRSASG